MPKKYFSKTRKYRRKGGGDGEWDIEKGTIIDVPPLRRIPTDPIKKQEELGINFTKSMAPAEAEAFFSGPTPEQQQRSERLAMEKYDKEDSDIAAYTDYSDMPLFSKGGRRRRRTRTRRHRRKTRRVRRRTKRHHKR